MSSPSLTGLSPNNPTKYLGPNVSTNIIVTRKRAPTGADVKQPETGKYYSFGTFWLVGKDPTTGVFGDLWFLSKIVAGVAYWIQFGGDFTIETRNTTLEFDQNGNDVTLDFRIENLIMGSSAINATGVGRNAAMGYFVLNYLTTGVNNSILGYGAGENIDTGSNNTMIGYISGSYLHDGSNNTGVGSESLGFNEGTSNNTAVGYRSGYLLPAGAYNSMFGALSGSNYTDVESNNVCIGSLGVAAEHNVVRIGNQGSSTNQQDTCFIAGIISTVNANATQLLVTIDSVTGRLGITNGYVKSIFADGFGVGYVQRAVNHQVLITNSIIGISNTGAPRTVTMPNAGMTAGQMWTIKDESGGASVNNITIAGNGANIDGAASILINTDYGTKTLYWNGTAFFTI